MRCQICQKEFIPNKYRPTQRTCSAPECQRLRQIQNEKSWRLKNPDYFKCLGQGDSWRESRHRYSRFWKVTHKNYLKTYAENHKAEHREYMREYMREHRKAGAVNGNKS